MSNILKTLWKNKKEILEGIKNSVIRDEFVEKIALLRNDICNNCELKGDDCAVKGTGPCCNECGCSLTFKTRSLSSSCPHPDGAKWKKIFTEKEENKIYKL